MNDARSAPYRSAPPLLLSLTPLFPMLPVSRNEFLIVILGYYYNHIGSTRHCI